MGKEKLIEFRRSFVPQGFTKIRKACTRKGSICLIACGQIRIRDSPKSPPLAAVIVVWATCPVMVVPAVVDTPGVPP